MKTLVLCCLIVLSSHALCREMLTKDFVSILAKPESSSETLFKVPKGRTLECRDRIGMFWEVKLEGDNWGYVRFQDLTYKMKSEHSNLSQSLIGAVQTHTDGDLSAIHRTRSTAASSRDLSSKTNALRILQSNPPNFRLVYIIEAHRISKSSVEAFGTELEEEIAKKVSPSPSSK